MIMEDDMEFAPMEEKMEVAADGISGMTAQSEDQLRIRSFFPETWIWNDLERSTCILIEKE